LTMCWRRRDLSRSSSLNRIRDFDREWGSTRGPSRDILKKFIVNFSNLGIGSVLLLKQTLLLLLL
jgi:hypothetical protein